MVSATGHQHVDCHARSGDIAGHQVWRVVAGTWHGHSVIVASEGKRARLTIDVGHGAVDFVFGITTGAVAIPHEVTASRDELLPALPDKNSVLGFFDEADDQRRDIGERQGAFRIETIAVFVEFIDIFL